MQGCGVPAHRFAQNDVLVATGAASVSYLGTGSFGETWRVTGPDGSHSVVKVIHVPGYDKERLAREVDGLNRVDSEFIVRLQSVQEIEVAGILYSSLWFEYIDGGDLSTHDAAAAPSGDDLVSLCRGLLSGCAELHAVDVVHRDIKPANICLRDGDPDRPVLLDLGLAKLLDVDSITKYPGFLGTFMYAAPEQLRGERARPTSDVWSVAVVVAELIMGRHPFFAEGERLTVSDALARQRVLPGLEDAPATVADFVRRGLSQEMYLRGSARAAINRLTGGLA